MLLQAEIVCFLLDQFSFSVEVHIISKMQRKKRYEQVQLSAIQRTTHLASPTSPAPQRNSRSGNMTEVISKKLSNLLLRQKGKFIRNVMYNLYGRHNSIGYKPEFNFQQRWENTHQQTIFEQKYSLLKTDNYWYITLHFVLYVLYGLTAWFYSVYRIFTLDSHFFIFVAVVMLAKVSDAIIKQVLLDETFAQNNDAKRELSIKDYIRFHWLSILSFGYLIVICAEESILGANKNQYLIVVDLFLAYSSYQRFLEIYSAIKFKSLSSNVRNEIQILQLFGGCIFLVHIFGLILYLVSKTNPQKNWTNGIAEFSSSWDLKYVYSVYFACTTALTVGYGDITPKNEFELITIMCVQILGIINIGYIVNEIGRVLSKINEKEEIWSNNISQTEKVIKKYHLPEHLAAKMRSNFINNRVANNELYLEEEDNLLGKFKEDLRQKIITHNHQKAVKYSVFFICNWTKKFQYQVARSLIRSIYSPQENITQIFGKQKIFLVTKGKLEIEACSSATHSQIRKTLNMVEFNPQKEVQFNVYGFSSCISGLKINIRAIAKDYAVCHHITKEDILRIIAESQSDFQYFHEIKDRILFSQIKEVWQAPNIANTREHYLPNIYYIIKKDKITPKKLNKRRNFLRNGVKHKCYVQQQIQMSQNDIDSDRENTKSLMESSIGEIIQPLKNNILSEKERVEKYNCMKKNEKAQSMLTNRKNRNRYPKLRHMNTEQFQREEIEKNLSGFQSGRHYKLYFSRFNLITIIKKYNKKFCLRQDSNMNRSQNNLADLLLNDDLVQKLMSAKAYSSLLL